jgi:hypothetical protein
MPFVEEEVYWRVMDGLLWGLVGNERSLAQSVITPIP